jgi:undecaprenyl-diphosphatase
LSSVPTSVAAGATSRGFVAAVVCFRIVSGTEVPSTWFAVSIGWAVGAARCWRSAYRASVHRPRLRTLVLSGTASAASSRLPSTRGSTPWFGTSESGQGLFIKVLGRDERTPTFCSVYRYLSRKNVGDERPFSTLRWWSTRLLAPSADVGVRTPHLRVHRDPTGCSLCTKRSKGLLDRVPEPWSDELLRGIWEQVALLRRERIKYRYLRRQSVRRHRRTPW